MFAAEDHAVTLICIISRFSPLVAEFKFQNKFQKIKKNRLLFCNFHLKDNTMAFYLQTQNEKIKTHESVFDLGVKL